MDILYILLRMRTIDFLARNFSDTHTHRHYYTYAYAARLRLYTCAIADDDDDDGDDDETGITKRESFGSLSGE